MASLLITFKLYLLALPLVQLAVLLEVAAVCLWYFLGPRFDAITPWLLYPLQWWNGLVYLLRQAANSFIRHGRRPGGPHFGYYQVGQLFDWKFEIYADEDRIHPWLKTYYDHWITATNALWFAGWMDPQTITKFFRWGSLVRYLYLWLSTLANRCRHWLNQSEWWWLVRLVFWRVWPAFWQLFSKPLWRLSQSLSRWMYGLAGDYNLAVGLLLFRLESFFRVLWYMDQNVDPDETADRFYFRPWPLAFYRIFWMTMQRPLSFVGRWSLPAFFGTVLLLLMLSLVAPLAFTAAFLLRSFWWYDRYGQMQFHWLKRVVKEPMQTHFLRLFSFLLAVLATLSSRLGLVLLRLFLAVARRFGWLVVFLALLLAVVTVFPYGLLAFGFGTILLTFFQDFFLALVPLAKKGPSLQGTEALAPEFFELLWREWQYDAIETWGTSFHGEYTWGGFPNQFPGAENHPWLPKRRHPKVWVRWWQQLKNFSQWERPIFQLALADRGRALTFMAAFQYSLEHAGEIAAKRIPVQRKLAVALLNLIRYKSTVLQWLASSPWKSIKASFFYAYYVIAYRFFYQYAGFYWLSLAWYQPFYTFCLVLSLGLHWGVLWPLDLLRWNLRPWMLYMPPVYYLALAVRRLGRLLWALWDSFVALLPTLPRSPQPRRVVTEVAPVVELPMFRRQQRRLRLFLMITLPLVYSIPPVIWPFDAIAEAIDSAIQQSIELLAFSFWWPYLPVVSVLVEELEDTVEPSQPVEGFLWWLPELPELPGCLGLLWSFTGGWLCWYASISFRDWSVCLYLPAMVLHWCLLMPYHAAWTFHSREEKWTALWTLALSVYLWSQEFWDRLFLTVELPRFLDDYTLPFYYIRGLTKGWLYLRTRNVAPKGAFLANVRWKLPPVHWYRETLAWTGSTPRSYSDHRLWPTASAVGDRTSALLPFYINNGFTLLYNHIPVLFLLAFFLVLAFFPGTSMLLFDRPGGPGSTTAIFSRQWAWEGCRYDQPLEELEALFFRKPSVVLRDSKIPVAYPWRAPRYLGRLLRRNRKNQGWPSALGPFLKQHSLAGGWSGQRRLYLTERRIILPFARYLFDSKYSSLRWNYLNLGLEFMKFIALNYRRSPWVPLCHNQYEKFDYHIWLGDASLDFARRATLAGRQTHRLLAWVDGQLFQKQLGQWVWYKDMGNQEFQQTLSEKRWKHLAYEVDEKDHECYLPWGPLFWLVAFPFSLYAQLFWSLELSWTAFPLYSGTGTSESRRWLLLLHSLFGHWAFSYEQIEGHTSGWWLIPTEERPDNNTTDAEEYPINQYYERWNRGFSQAYYMIPMSHPHRTASTVAPWGTSQPLGLLEEYLWVRRLVLLLVVVALPLLRTTKTSQGVTLASHRRWPLLTATYEKTLNLYLWFWK